MASLTSRLSWRSDLRELNLGAVEVKVRAGWGRAALVLVTGAVDSGAVGVLGGRTGSEQAELADLHARPELDRQRRDVRQLKGHVAGKPGIDPPRRRVRQQPQPSETGVVSRDVCLPGEEQAGRIGDLDAANRARLAQANIRDRAEAVVAPRPDLCSLTPEPEDRDRWSELHLVSGLLLNPVRGAVPFPLGRAQPEPSGQLDHRVGDPLVGVHELTATVVVHVAVGIHKTLD